MVDVNTLIESMWVNAELVSNLDRDKRKAMINAEKVDTVTYDGESFQKLTLSVTMLGKDKKYYRPNINSLKNLKKEYGDDSTYWVGKTIKFELESINGRLCVIAYPHTLPK